MSEPTGLRRGRRIGRLAAPLVVLLVVLTMVSVSLATLLTSLPMRADAIREAQWPLHFFQAEKVWEISRGDGVVVGLVDSGVNEDHPDLSGQILPGGDVSGASDGRIDREGHGTAMASLIAGRGHGPEYRDGVMGLAPGARILPVRIDTRGRAARRLGINQLESTAWGIRWAADHGAKVINVSLGFEDDLPQMREAVEYAIGKDAVVVASAGNEAREGNPIEYPAGYPGVVAVGAVDRNRGIWPDSQHGSQLVLAAPGVGITSAVGEYYDQGDGTSDAAAHVSAIAALVRAKYPQLTSGQVIRRMIATSDPVGNGARNEHFGYGIVDPFEALTATMDPGPRDNPLVSGVAVPHRQDSDAGESAWQRLSSLPAVALAAAVAVLLALLVALGSRRRGAARDEDGGYGLDALDDDPDNLDGSGEGQVRQPEAGRPTRRLR